MARLPLGEPISSSRAAEGQRRTVAVLPGLGQPGAAGLDEEWAMRLLSRPSRAVTAVAVALGAVLLASCGAVGQNTRGAADDTSRVRVLNPYGGDRAAEGTPKAGGNLIIGNDREIVSFDPTRQNGNVAA